MHIFEKTISKTIYDKIMRLGEYRNETRRTSSTDIYKKYFQKSSIDYYNICWRVGFLIVDKKNFATRAKHNDSLLPFSLET